MYPIRAARTDRYFEPVSEPTSSIDRIIVIGLMAVIVGSALAFGAVEPWSLATFGLLIMAFLVLWGIKGMISGALKICLPSTALPLVALLLLAVLQGVTVKDSAGGRSSISLDAEATHLTAEILLVLLLAFLLSANFLAIPRALPWLRNFLIFFGLALAVFGLLQHLTWNGKFFWVIELRFQPPSPFGPFVNHNHFAGYLEMIAPIPVALILRRAVRGELAVLYGFAAAMMGLAIIMSLSRGGMISLVASLMFIVAFGYKPSTGRQAGVRQSSRTWPVAASRIGAMALMLFTIGVGVWWVGADSVIRRLEKGELTIEATDRQPGKETFFYSRGWIWRDTMAMIRENWVTGVGLGAYPTAYPIYSTRDRISPVNQAHNDYLQILADAGILGAIIALWFIFLVARDTVRASRHRNPLMAAIALGCASGMFALIVHSLFDFNLQIPSNALLFLVLTSVVSRIAAAATSKKEEKGDQDIHDQSAPSLWIKAAV
ncbi:MAG TPA: O-antigen ligase family protein [Blastocatellia bacterium]|nr:O-antigen ligase family protein [Blastocatellia bacterium]